MNWLSILIRTVGAGFPGASSLVQLQSELDSAKLQERVRQLEDPISSLHPDVTALSAILYRSLQAAGSKIVVTEEIYPRYSRALRILDAQGFLNVTHVIGRAFPDWFWITEPTYILYMAALYEEPAKMDSAVNRIDQAPAGTWIRGEEVSVDTGIPIPVVKAILQLYEARGLGIMSNENGTVNYYVQA
jgi:hypothetical protein